MDWISLITKLLPLIKAAFEAIQATGKTHAQAAAELEDHLTPGKPNSPALGK